MSVAEHDDEVDVMRTEAAAALGPDAGAAQVHVVVGTTPSESLLPWPGGGRTPWECP